MSLFQAQFDEAVCKIVSNIPPGQVMAYGEIAKAAGYPRHARMVSKALSRSDKKLPWHRVVRSDRSLAFSKDSQAFDTQKSLLMEEGIAVLKGKVMLPKPESPDDLDALIWGPD
jgi:methylated-DNA-protein-cysteine methyltransferase-like protein